MAIRCAHAPLRYQAAAPTVTVVAAARVAIVPARVVVVLAAAAWLPAPVGSGLLACCEVPPRPQISGAHLHQLKSEPRSQRARNNSNIRYGNSKRGRMESYVDLLPQTRPQTRGS